MEQTKTCPECRTEYRETAHVCADCGVTLAWTGSRSLGSVPGGPVAPASDLPALDANGWDDLADAGILGLLANDDEDVIRAYLAHLQAAGIRGAVLPTTRYVGKSTRLMQSPVFGTALLGGKPGQVPVGNVLEGFNFELYVTRTDFEAARDVIDEAFPALHPDCKEGLTREFDLGTCPACGGGVPDDADECPDCGLFLG